MLRDALLLKEIGNWYEQVMDVVSVKSTNRSSCAKAFQIQCFEKVVRELAVRSSEVFDIERSVMSPEVDFNEVDFSYAAASSNSYGWSFSCPLIMITYDPIGSTDWVAPISKLI